MESTTEHRPKVSNRFFGRFRTQLLTVFLIMVSLIVLIGLLSVYSQARTRATAEQLINIDAKIVQNALLIQANLAEMDRLEEGFLTSLDTQTSIEDATIRYANPWFRLETDVKDELNTLTELSADAENVRAATTNLTSLGFDQLALARRAFEQVISAQSGREQLLASMASSRSLNQRFESAELGNFQVSNQNLSNILSEYLLDKDDKHLTNYKAQAALLIANLANTDLSEEEIQLITDQINANVKTFTQLQQLDENIVQQQSTYDAASKSNGELISTVVEETLKDQAQRQSELTLFNRNTLFGIGALFGISILVALIYLATGGSRTIRQVENLNTTTDQIQEGDYQVRAKIISSDETGAVARQMNDMLDFTFSLIQSSEEQASLQESIFLLINDVAEVAEGDLTIRARGTHDLTRPIAQAFNETIAQLHDVIAQIQATTIEVGAATDSIQLTTESLATSSEAQADYIVDTSAAVDEMSISIQHVSENSLQSAAVSAQALSNARIGAEAVDQTIAGMKRIQAEVEKSVGQVARVDQSSKNISKSIGLIDELADRTSVLALNATIRALAAGSDGRGFAVVAREIEDLAEQAVQATQRVNQLTAEIESDAAKALDAMAYTQTGVEDSLQIAENATNRLTDIEQVATRLSDIIRDISHAASQQARSSESVAISMNDIAQVTRQTASGTREAISSISSLTQLANELRESISIFKLQSDQDALLDAASSQLAAGD